MGVYELRLMVVYGWFIHYGHSLGLGFELRSNVGVLF